MYCKRIFLATAVILGGLSVGMQLSSCGSDLFTDPAGTCVTCTYAATTASSERVLTACADGEGNITVTESGEADQTSERTLEDFRLPHENNGASCQ